MARGDDFDAQLTQVKLARLDERLTAQDKTLEEIKKDGSATRAAVQSMRSELDELTVKDRHRARIVSFLTGGVAALPTAIYLIAKLIGWAT